MNDSLFDVTVPVRSAINNAVYTESWMELFEELEVWSSKQFRPKSIKEQMKVISKKIIRLPSVADFTAMVPRMTLAYVRGYSPDIGETSENPMDDKGVKLASEAIYSLFIDKGLKGKYTNSLTLVEKAIISFVNDMMKIWRQHIRAMLSKLQKKLGEEPDATIPSLTLAKLLRFGLEEDFASSISHTHSNYELYREDTRWKKILGDWKDLIAPQQSAAELQQPRLDISINRQRRGKGPMRLARSLIDDEAVEVNESEAEAENDDSTEQYDSGGDTDDSHTSEENISSSSSPSSPSSSSSSSSNHSRKRQRHANI
jgi:hypothetical protein